MNKSEPRMETMMEPMHPRRLEKKANIKRESARRQVVAWLFLEAARLWPRAEPRGVGRLLTRGPARVVALGVRK
jgi:hypothetical protein